eukprot:GHVU01199297.1.p2 GENE.GHVU01199297.1~~GHVU01199297.1.p2  ORF type:complete len:115 (-),score=19.65 GHVU01199297.1:70-414(-)
MSGEGCGERACICSTACRSMAKAMDAFDGEPELETHPDIATVTTTLIAVVTRSGTQTGTEEIDTEEQSSQQIPCGQTTRLVHDVPMDSEEEPDDPEAAVPDLRSDDEDNTEEIV